MLQAARLGLKIGILRGRGVDGLDGLQPGAQAGGLLGARPGAGLPLRQFLGGAGPAPIGLGVAATQGGVLEPAEGVEGGALGGRGAQAELVGLPVDGHETGPDLGEHRRGHGAAPEVGP